MFIQRAKMEMAQEVEFMHGVLQKTTGYRQQVIGRFVLVVVAVVVS